MWKVAHYKYYYCTVHCCILVVFNFRPPGTVVRTGLCFTADVLIFFLRQEISELPRSIVVKLWSIVTFAASLTVSEMQAVLMLKPTFLPTQLVYDFELEGHAAWGYHMVKKS